MSGSTRWHARLRGFYANRENLHKYAELRPTDEELKRFYVEHPDLGEKLERCRLEKEFLSKFYFFVLWWYLLFLFPKLQLYRCRNRLFKKERSNNIKNNLVPSFHKHSVKGTAIGTLGCVVAGMRTTSVKPYILVMGVSGFFASLFGARNLGVWVAGTYKFDTATLNAAYLSWVESSRAAAAAADADGV